MVERVEKVELAIGEFRERFDAVDRRFDAVDQRFDAIDRRFEAIDRRFEVVDQRFDAVDRRLDDLEQRLNTKIDIQVEHLETLVRTTADNFGGVLERIERELLEFRSEMREESRLTRKVLADHEHRMTALERRRRH